MVTAEKEMLDNLLSRCRSGVIRWEVHFPLLSVLPSSWPVRFLCSYCLARASLVVCVRIVLCRHGLLVSKFAQPQLNKNTTETKHFLTVKSNRVWKAMTVFFLFFFRVSNKILCYRFSTRQTRRFTDNVWHTETKINERKIQNNLPSGSCNNLRRKTEKKFSERS